MCKPNYYLHRIQLSEMIIMKTQEHVLPTKRAYTEVLTQTIKTGIIKSNLIPMVAGLTLALYTFNLNLIENLPNIILAVLGSALVIGAAGAFNNLYDRDIDILMERTKNRPTVTGDIQPITVLWMAISMVLVGLLLLALTTPMAALFGLLGLFFYVVPYTMWSKRRTIYNTEIGSISGAMPVLIGWTAVHSSIDHPAIISLFVISMIWQMPHFYAIAIRKHDDYKAANVPMLPVVKGFKRTVMQTNVYLVVLALASLLLMPVSITLMTIGLVLSAGWLVLSIYGRRKMEQRQWANTMFFYSLLHMTLLFSAVIVFSLLGIIF